MIPALHTSLINLTAAIVDPLENEADRLYLREWRAETMWCINQVMGVGDRLSPLESARVAVENALEVARVATARSEALLVETKKIRP